jgi:hypothetical protein
MVSSLSSAHSAQSLARSVMSARTGSLDLADREPLGAPPLGVSLELVNQI